MDPSLHWFEVNKLSTEALASGEFGDVSNANGANPVSLPNPIQPLYREWLEMRIGWMKDLFVEEVVPRTGGRRKECELAISRIGVGGAIFACGWVASIGYFNIFISPSDLVEKDSDQFV